MRAPKILVALDVDGVVNVQNERATCGTRIGDIFPTWEPEMPAKLLRLAAHPNVAVAWLSDWAMKPEQLREFERALGVGPWPHPVETLTLPHLTNNAFSVQWWKHAGLRELERLTGAERTVWVDDNLYPDQDQLWYRWLYGVHPDHGLDTAAVERIEDWIGLNRYE